MATSPTADAEEPAAPRPEAAAQRRVSERHPPYARPAPREVGELRTVEPPGSCGGSALPAFREVLLALGPVDSSFYVELWGDRTHYQVLDHVYYQLRSNQDAWVTLYWIGPDGGIFVPFSNLQISADKDYRVDASNVVVEPVGIEYWRAIATPEPHELLCHGSDEELVAALARVRSGKHAAAAWAVETALVAPDRLPHGSRKPKRRSAGPPAAPGKRKAER